MRRGVGVVVAAIIAAVTATTVDGAVRNVPDAPHVLIIGDSVATGMLWHDDAIAVAQTNLNVEWDVAICRRLVGASCVDEGTQPPTLVDDIDARTSVPPLVVVEMGYNDFADTFPASIDAAMQALLARGARHVLWLTLRESEAPFPDLNVDLWAALERWPQLELVDWNALSANQPNWFQTDGVHLLAPGGMALAHLVHGAVVRIVSPLRIEDSLPNARHRRGFRAVLHAAGGTRPFHWRALRLPRGMHLLANGTIYGRVRSTGTLVFSVEVVDADGAIATSRVVTDSRG